MNIEKEQKQLKNNCIHENQLIFERLRKVEKNI